MQNLYRQQRPRANTNQLDESGMCCRNSTSKQGIYPLTIANVSTVSQ